MNKKLTTSVASAVSVAALTLLTSCGGGSSGGGVSTPPTTVQFMRPITDTEQFMSDAIAAVSSLDDVGTAVADAAGGTVRATVGIVTQANLSQIFNIEVGTDGFDFGIVPAPRITLDRPRTAFAAEDANSPGRFGSYASEVAAGIGSLGYNVYLFTDYEGSGDSDYLTGGFWLRVNEGSGNIIISGHTFDSYEVGAFAGGNLPFDFSTASVSGSAMYTGAAVGTCNCASGNDMTVAPRVFEAAALLNADFGSGTISGTIDAFVVDGETLPGARAQSVSLMTATIGDSAGGFFTDDILLNGAGSGEWGGQFYGDNAGNALPGSVGGTFGASDGTETFVGAFGAHLDR